MLRRLAWLTFGGALLLGVITVSPETARAVPAPRIAIDADLSNGVCDPVDAAAAVPKGATLRIAVCLLDAPDAPEAFTVHVGYDTKMLFAPEVADAGSALDDNPDANAGTTTFGAQTLGVGWDCTTFGVFSPVADDKQLPGGDAKINCNGDLLQPNNTLHSGALVVITLEALKRGATQITVLPDTSYAWPFGTLELEAGCSAPDEPIACDGARIDVGKATHKPHLP